MVDNQHRQIKGYTDMTPEQIALFNEGKEIANSVGEYVNHLLSLDDTDKRWVHIGKTQLQQGFMALLRGISKPDSF